MTALTQPPSIKVLGVRVHMLQIPDVLKIAEQWIEKRDTCRYIVATGMHGVMEAQRSTEFKNIANSADLFVADGISLVWVARCRGIRLKKRVSGADLMWEWLKLAAESGYKMFFYGDTEDTLNRLTERLKLQFPGLNIVGAYSPPFRTLTPEEDEEEVRMINDSGADVVWVGLGLPKQERWMFEHRERLNTPVLVGVGAAFKFASGQVKRAPPWLGDRGLEWLWRFAHEPKRVWRRVFIDGPNFAFRVILELSGLKKYG